MVCREEYERVCVFYLCTEVRLTIGAESKWLAFGSSCGACGSGSGSGSARAVKVNEYMFGTKYKSTSLSNSKFTEYGIPYLHRHHRYFTSAQCKNSHSTIATRWRCQHRANALTLIFHQDQSPLSPLSLKLTCCSLVLYQRHSREDLLIFGHTDRPFWSKVNLGLPGAQEADKGFGV